MFNGTQNRVNSDDSLVEKWYNTEKWAGILKRK